MVPSRMGMAMPRSTIGAIFAGSAAAELTSADVRSPPDRSCDHCDDEPCPL
jgi:hypothetical protein